MIQKDDTLNKGFYIVKFFINFAFSPNHKTHCSKISVKIPIFEESFRWPTLFHNKQNPFFERHLITITENITGWDLLLRLFYNLSSSPFSSCHKTRIYFDNTIIIIRSDIPLLCPVILSRKTLIW